MKRWPMLLGLLWQLCAAASEIIPPAPQHYFNDYAHVVSLKAAVLLEKTLEDDERLSSDQIVVAIFPKMLSDAPVKDYAGRIANSWHVGQKGKNNGVTVFLFVQNHKIYVDVGKGLDKALTDAVCESIIRTRIIPRLEKGDFDGGLLAGVKAIIAATKGAH